MVCGRNSIITDLAPLSPLVVVGARGVNRRGCRGVGQDVDEVWIHHVVIKQVKDAHSIRSICEGKHAETLESDSRSTSAVCPDVEVSKTHQD